MKSTLNSFSVDLEDWYQGNEFISASEADRYEDRLRIGTNILLDLLAEFKISATFFILGHIAEKNRDLVRKIHQLGHEIASHGYSHELVYRQTPDQFRFELRKSKDILENIIGASIQGHRASNWTITENSLWALDIIAEEGFRYDSSIFPTKNYLFGIPTAPRFTHRLENGLVEVPPSTLKLLGKNMPFSGGFFLRSLPSQVIHWGIKQLNSENQPAVLYIHPWELDALQPRNLPIPLKNKIIHYFGISRTRNKLSKIFSNFAFDRIDRVFEAQLKVGN